MNTQMDASARRIAIGVGALAGLAVYTGLGRWSSMAKTRRCLTAALASLGTYVGTHRLVRHTKRMTATQLQPPEVELTEKLTEEEEKAFEAFRKTCQQLEALIGSIENLNKQTECQYLFGVVSTPMGRGRQFDYNPGRPIIIKAKLRRETEARDIKFELTREDITDPAPGELGAILVWDANLQHEHTSHDTLWRWRADELCGKVPEGYQARVTSKFRRRKAPTLQRNLKNPKSGMWNQRAMTITQVPPKSGAKPWRLTFTELRPMSPQKLQQEIAKRFEAA